MSYIFSYDVKFLMKDVHELKTKSYLSIIRLWLFLMIAYEEMLRNNPSMIEHFFRI